MKLLLIATNRERSPYPVAPLGVLCVAAAARAAGHVIEFLDLGCASSPSESLQRALEADQYDAVAFGIRNLDNCWSFAPRCYFDDVRLLAETVRRSFQGPLILGGTGFSVSPLGWMRRLGADCGVIGEGERVFPELLSRLESGKSAEGMEGVITAAAARGEEAPRAAQAIDRLGDLTLPAHDLCEYSRYVGRGGFVGVQTKRGCPFKCSYCIYPQLEGKRYRLRPPEKVADEVAEVSARAKMRHFFFVDSVFNDPRKHALEICRALARRRLPVRWEAFCNPAGFDEELARNMAAAGCAGVEFGLDVATPKMLKAMGKPFGQEEIRIALEAARKAGLPFAIYLLFGGPGETWDDIRETQKFLAECAPAHAVFASFGIRVYEGAPLAQTAVQEGLLDPARDLFEPAYYLSPGIAENTEKNLDRIARRCNAWSSPADWRRMVTKWGQKVTVRLNVRPQWKYMRRYGRYMRWGGT